MKKKASHIVARSVSCVIMNVMSEGHAECMLANTGSEPVHRASKLTGFRVSC